MVSNMGECPRVGSAGMSDKSSRSRYDFSIDLVGWSGQTRIYTELTSEFVEGKKINVFLL
jgi:hypothetical protein